MWCYELSKRNTLHYRRHQLRCQESTRNCEPHRVMEPILRYSEESLGLTVNGEKSRATKTQEVTFRGFRIYRYKIRVSPESLERFQGQVRDPTRRDNPPSMFMAARKLNSYSRRCGHRREATFTDLRYSRTVTEGHRRARQTEKGKSPFLVAASLASDHRCSRAGTRLLSRSGGGGFRQQGFT